MSGVANTVLSVIAVCVSVVAAWFTIFHKGTVKMTRPNLFALLPSDSGEKRPKVFLRSMLFSTGKRGRVIESLFIRIKRAGHSQAFLYWAHGHAEELEAGSGLYIGPEGFVENHHFMLTENGSTYQFEPGRHDIEILGTLLGLNSPKVLHRISFDLSDDGAKILNSANETAALYLWNPDAQTYSEKLDRRPTQGRSRSVSGAGKGRFDWE